MIRRSVAGLAILVLAAGMTACSSDDVPSTGLIAMLGKVQATDESRAYVEYGNLDQQRELMSAAPDRARALSGIGLGDLSGYSVLIKDDLGIDLLGMHEAIRVGSPPHWAGLVVGDYDAATLAKRLTERHVQREDRDGATYWSSGKDNEFTIDGPMADIVPAGQLTKLRTTKDSFAFSPDSGSLALVTEPSGGTLADDPVVKDLANCLGDVVTAQIMTAGPAKMLVATGVRAASAYDTTEVVCAEPGNDQAGQLQQRAISELASGQTTRQVPWKQVLPGAKAELAGLSSGAVRISAPTPSGKPMGVVNALQPADLADLFGA